MPCPPPSRRAPLFCAVLAGLTGSAFAGPGCGPLDIPVLRIEGPPAQYARFCEKYPQHCALAGEAILPFGAEVETLLSAVNAAVNREITLTPDWDRLGVEEDWDFPRDCRGDCEDFALEKRRRLIAAGLPGASLTLAIVHHRNAFFAHAVLLAETDRGTLVLDNVSDALVCWDDVPYRYERREKPDGRWLRFSAN